MAVVGSIPKTLTELGGDAKSWVSQNTVWIKAVLDAHTDLLKTQQVEKYQKAYDGFIESVDLRDKDRGDGINNKLFINLAQLVIDTAVDYMIAKPPVYTIENNDQADKDTSEAPILTEYRKEILELLQTEEARLQLAEMLRQGSIAGYSTIIAWVNENSEIEFSEFPIQESIPVYNAQGKLKLFIRKYEIEEIGDDGKTTKVTKLEIYDDRYIIYVKSDEKGESFELDQEQEATGNPIEHKAARIPVSVFINGTAAAYDTRVKRAGTSDIGNGVFSLLEAYAHGLSDKANLVEYLQDQYLLLKGVDTDEKEVTKMRKARAIALKSKDSDASFIAQTQEDKAVENYLARVEAGIYDTTLTPRLNKLEGATATEIKMKYAALDIKAGKKELFFVVAIKQLVKVLTDFLNNKRLGGNGYDILKDKEAVGKRQDLYNPKWLTFTLNRNLPQNNKEIADIVAELSGKVPDSYLIELLWFIDDPVKALEEMKQQKKEALQDNMAALGYGGEFTDTSTAKEDEDDGENQE